MTSLQKREIIIQANYAIDSIGSEGGVGLGFKMGIAGTIEFMARIDSEFKTELDTFLRIKPGSALDKAINERIGG